MAHVGSLKILRCFGQSPQFLVRFEVFTAVTVKNAVFWDVTPCDSCNNDVAEERVSSIFLQETHVFKSQ
jgi:hypothetical protein